MQKSSILNWLTEEPLVTIVALTTHKEYTITKTRALELLIEAVDVNRFSSLVEEEAQARAAATHRLLQEAQERNRRKPQNRNRNDN